MRPRSGITVEGLYQTRAEFDRNLVSVRLYYDWWETNSKQHTFTPIDLQSSFVNVKDSTFFTDLQVDGGFQSVVYISTRYKFTYDERATGKKGNFRLFTTTVETSGNLLSQIFANPVEDGADKLFGVQMSQFVRGDVDFRYYWNFRNQQSLVFRAFAGVLYAYGNGEYVLPFEKWYFAGGTNDIRAWVAYRLGPGGFRDGLGQVNVAPLKLMANMEYRYNIYRSIKGALFVDMGNIWFIQPNIPLYSGGLEDIPEAFFQWDTFSDQIAMGLGTGIRYDLQFFVIRLDAAIPIRTPFLYDGKSSQWFPLRFKHIPN
jgi:hypothetical protein